MRAILSKHGDCYTVAILSFGRTTIILMPKDSNLCCAHIVKKKCLPTCNSLFAHDADLSKLIHISTHKMAAPQHLLDT